MQKNNWIVGLVILILIIVLSIWVFSKSKTPTDTNIQTPSNEPPVAVAGVDTSKFFDENATIMFFYSDGCGWCTKEKAVLAELAPDGYRVKPMDVGKNQSLWKTYNISGTPTLIDKNGNRSEGFLEKEPLKAWLDAHK